MKIVLDGKVVSKKQQQSKKGNNYFLYGCIIDNEIQTLYSSLDLKFVELKLVKLTCNLDMRYKNLSLVDIF